MSTDLWASKLRASRALLDECRADAETARSAAVSVAERRRAVTLARRKLNRLDDVLDVLDDCARDGVVSDGEAAEREAIAREMQREARGVRSACASAEVELERGAGGGGGSAAGTMSSVTAAIGRGVSEAAATVAGAAGDLATRATEAVPGLERAATLVIPGAAKRDGETRETRAMTTRELIDHQTEQMKVQDDALEGLDKLVGSLKTTSEAIHDEVALQQKLVEDLEADFAHTQERMRKLRKQGFKLAGEKNEEERERLDRNEVLAEMRAKLERPQQEDSSCSIM